MKDILKGIEAAIEDIKAGKMLVVVDDENRENEGDLIMSGEKVTPADINFMAQKGRGLICAPISNEIADRLDLYHMAKKNNEAFRTNFTISVDYRFGTTTGISATDRAKTINALAADSSKPDDFAQPGHVFPIRACDDGVLERQGHTEATLDLMKLAGLKGVGALCEIAEDSGEMARLPFLIEFAKNYKLRLISIKDLIEYRKKHKESVKKGG